MGLQAQGLLHMANVLGHQRLGPGGVTHLQGLDDRHVLLTRVCGVMRALVPHGDQGGACREVAQGVRKQLVAQALGQTHVKITQQVAALAHIAAL